MTRLRKFLILVTNSETVYFPGQCIQGHLVVELEEEMKIRGIYLTCRGEGRVRWSRGNHSNSDIEEYINIRLTLFCNDSDNNVTLNAGKHGFPFEIVLPPNIPGSFDGQIGCYVRYFLKATIDRPWKSDKTYKLVFTVASIVDLNTVENADTPVQTEDSETFGCLCCESDPVSATFRMDKIAYVPGEWIVFDAEIQDGRGRGIASSMVRLMMSTVYKLRRIKGIHYEQKREVGRLVHGRVSPGGSDVWRRERLRVPPLPPSFLQNCSIIEINYYIELAINIVDTPYYDIRLPLSVVIGSIPLHSTIQQYRSQIQSPQAITEQPRPAQEPQGAEGRQEPSAPPDFDMPPPSYKECVLGKVDTMEENEKNAAGTRNFAPSYTYYDWLQ